MPLVRDGIAWDGNVYPYVPGPALEIDPSLRLHTDAQPEAELDPVTYEVVRHALWNVNVEAGRAIGKISGSPIASLAHDLNTGILTEDGEWVFFGPFLQFQNAAAESGIKWMLEFRSRNPGIRNGDMFLCNDPWIGVLHQSDTLVFCPVFVEERLFCWVVSGLHEYDIGGSTPGSFCPDAADVFLEPQPIPPIRLVEQGELREDVEAMYLRGSRMPHMLALDLRAKIAGCEISRRRVLEFVGRYGAEAVKGVMRKVIDDAERAFVQRISRLPNGEWAERSYLEVALPGDRGAYPLWLTVRKEGGDLYFSNAGTHAQVGNINGSYIGYKGGVMTAVSVLFLYDQLYALGGAMRRCHFELEPGTITCPTHPAAVNSGPAHVVVLGVAQAVNVLSKMIVADEGMRGEAMAAGGSATWPVASLAGLDQRGNFYGTVLLGGLAGSIGGFAGRDGLSTGGLLFDPQCKSPNVEFDEMFFPLLFLYSRERPDGGGAGRFAGGTSLEQAFVPHDTDAVLCSIAACGVVVPPARGLFGGFPGAGNRYRMVRGSDIRARLGAGELPQSLEQLGGEVEELPPKAASFVQGPDDVYEIGNSCAAGWGDPLEREPERVTTDLAAGRVSAARARGLYGVVLGEDGSIDTAATEAERARLRAERLCGAGGGSVERVPAAAGALRFHEYLEQRTGRVACRCCDADLGPAEVNYKLHAVVRERTPAEAGVLVPPAELWIDRSVVLREFFCPGCAVLLDVEVALDGDEPLFDVKVGAAAPYRSVRSPP